MGAVIRALAVLLAVATWAQLLVSVVWPTMAGGHFPTSAYWVAPRLVLTGHADLLWDVTAFADAAAGLGAYRDLGFVPNAPLGLLPLLPFGLLPEAPAYVLWTSLSLAALVASLALAWATLRPSLTVGLIVVAAVPLFQPLRSNFAVGQIYVFVLLAVVVAALVQTRATGRTSAAGGLGLAAVAILKLYYGLAVLVPAVLLRLWRTLGVALAVLLGGVLVTLVLWGPTGWRVWLEAVLGWRARPETSVTAYQTLTSLFGHLFRFDAKWNPQPVADLPVFADALFFAAAALLGLTTLVAIVRSGRSVEGRLELLPLAMVVPLAVLLSPVAENDHYVLTLFALAVCGAILLGAQRGSVRVTLWAAYVGAIVLLAPPWPFNVAFVGGWAALLYYPRVYGALLLWAVLLALTWRPPPMKEQE